MSIQLPYEICNYTFWYFSIACRESSIQICVLPPPKCPGSSLSTATILFHFWNLPFAESFLKWLQSYTRVYYNLHKGRVCYFDLQHTGSCLGLTGIGKEKCRTDWSLIAFSHHKSSTFSRVFMEVKVKTNFTQVHIHSAQKATCMLFSSSVWWAQSPPSIF